VEPADRPHRHRVNDDAWGLSRWSGFSGGGHTMTVDHLEPSMLADQLQFQLPPDIRDLVGRDDAVREVERQLDQPDRTPGAVVASIAGRAGVGKTTLAVRVARRLARSFPDGQLYVNLGGQEAPALPEDVQGDLLLAFGVARAEIEDDARRRTDQYRAQLSHRRVLLLLDNAAETRQVEALLPDSPGSAALVTSRAALGRLGATGSVLSHDMVLDVLDEEQAVALLAHAVGDGRVAREQDAARRIVELCGYLPLAVRIAGARLAGNRQTSLAAFAYRLEDEQDRLAGRRIRDLEVRSSFALHYQALRADERRLFRLLAVVGAPDFPDWVAASVLDCPLDQARELIRRLVAAEILARARPGQARYRFHDLLRVLARDHLGTEESPAARDAALGRVLGDWVELASRAAELLEPGTPPSVSTRPPPARLSAAVGSLSDDPAAWFDQERISLLAAVDQAYDTDRLELTWRLARSLSYFLKLRTHWTDWHNTQQLALRAARRAGDEPATANALRSLGDVRTHLGQLESAIQDFSEAQALFTRIGARDGLAWTLFGLGGALHEQGEYDRAEEHLQNAIVLFRDPVGDRRGEAWALGWLGIVRRYQGKLEEARARFSRSLALLREVGDRRGEAYCLVNLAAVHRDRRQFEPGMRLLDQAEPVFDELADRQGAADVLLLRGQLLRERGRHEEAEEILVTCVEAMRRLGDRSGEGWTRFNLAMVHQGRGRHGEAMVEFRECRRIFSAIPEVRGTAWTSMGVGHGQLQQGQLDAAIASFRQALALLPEGDELGQAKALSGLGRALAAHGEPAPAAGSWRSAQAIFRRLGSEEAAEVEAMLAEWG
jgi:tetratricopeptide (TPR) repeat protein